MAIDKLVDSTQLDADLTAVANAIRAKGSTSAQLSFPSGMAQAIAGIQYAPATEERTVTITENGTTDVTKSANVDGMTKVTVTTNVPQLDTSDATATAANIDSGCTAYVNGTKVTGTSSKITPSGSIDITQNGTYNVTDKASAVVNVPSSPSASLYWEIDSATNTLTISETPIG